MILAMDIGNSNIHLGLFEKKQLEKQIRFTTQIPMTCDECFVMIREIIKNRKPEHAVMCSVVPSLDSPFKIMLRHYLDINPLIIDETIDTGLTIRYHEPSTIGADRIANAVGALAQFSNQKNIIIVDFGTATTFDVITREGEYLGGAIAPGIQMGLSDLTKKTAKLFEVRIKIPDHCIGKNTEECIQSGIFFSTRGQVERIIYEIEKETDKEFHVIATGGLSEKLAPHIQRIDTINPFLTLKGLIELYEKNQ